MTKVAINKTSSAGLIALALAWICCSGVLAAEVSGPRKAAPKNVSAPTMETTRRSYSREDVIPENIKTLEDYQGNYGGNAGRVVPGYSGWRVVGSLAIIVLLIIGSVYLLRMTMAKGLRYDLKGKHIRILDVVQLGLNRSLYLVSVGGRAMLIGSSDKGLSFISDVTGAEGMEAEAGYNAEGGVSFADHLGDAAAGQTGGADRITELLEERLRRLEEDRND